MSETTATEDTGTDADGPVTMIEAPIHIELDYRPGVSQQPFLRATQRRELLGRRCSECAKVYFPPRGVCSMCGAPFTDEPVVVEQTGTVTTFLIVNVNFAAREVDLPYVAAEVLFDGSDITNQYLLLGVPHDEVRMGMRVRAVWKDGDDLPPTLSNISHVEPIDEPDAPYDSYAEAI